MSEKLYSIEDLRKLADTWIKWKGYTTSPLYPDHNDLDYIFVDLYTNGMNDEDDECDDDDDDDDDDY